MAPTRWQPRARSPQDDDFHTGQSDFNPDEALHSTAQFNPEQKHWTSRYESKKELDLGSVSELSDEQSIEIGRGLKRPLQDFRNLDSSQIMFTFGNDSQYELTGTPNAHNNLVSKNESNQRKTSTMRRANESAKRSASQNARVLSNLSEKIRLQTNKMGRQNDWDDEEEVTASLSAKNTRFGHAKQPQQYRVQAQRRPGNYDAADSFQLPDISGIEELVQGPISRPKPLPLRAAIGKSRSRFTPAPRNRVQGPNDPPTERIPVHSVPIPEDEKRIYSSLQHLRDRIAQLESEKASAWSQLDRYENEVVELRSALAREEHLRRPDSALGSDEETEKEKWRLERTRLQASVRALRQQLDRSDRKTQQSTNVLGKVTTERDNLVTQLGVECFRLSKAEAEIGKLQADQVSLLQQNNDLHQELSIIKEELAAVKGQTEKRRSSYGPDIHPRKHARQTSTSRQEHVNNAQQTTKHNESASKPQQTYLTSLDHEARQSIAAAVQIQFDRLTLNARDKATQQKPANTAAHRSSGQQASLFPEPLGLNDHNATRTQTEFELTNTQSVPFVPVQQAETQQDGNDMTELSQNEPGISIDLRQTLERVRRESHKRRQASAPVATESVCEPAERDNMANVTRKSSFKSAKARRNSTQSIAEDAAKAARVVRVQSPDHIESREAFAAFVEGDNDNDNTSAFIIPDVTLQGVSVSGQIQDLCIQHDDHACTVCTKHGQTQHNNIPIPEFASSRTDLPEDATLRPSQPSYEALAKVLKQLKDESIHLHLILRNLESQYHAHDPAVGERARRVLNDKISQLRADCDRKDGQIYSLHDALEAHREEHERQQRDDGDAQHVQNAPGPASAANGQSVGVERARVARGALPLGLDGAYDDESDSGSIGLPEWDGLSEGE